MFGHMTMSKPSDCRFLTNLGKYYFSRISDDFGGFDDFNDYVDFLSLIHISEPTRPY